MEYHVSRITSHVTHPRKRLRKLLGLQQDVDVVTSYDIMYALQETTNKKAKPMDKRQVDGVLAEFRVLQRRFLVWVQDAQGSAQAQVELDVLVELLLHPSLPDQVSPGHRETARELQDVLLAQAVEDLITETTREAAADFQEVDYNLKEGSRSCGEVLEERVQLLAMLAVLASTLVMGVSLDVDPAAAYWTIIEAACAVIFLAEMLVKLANHGCRGYFLHREMMYWRSEANKGTLTRRMIP